MIDRYSHSVILQTINRVRVHLAVYIEANAFMRTTRFNGRSVVTIYCNLTTTNDNDNNICHDGIDRAVDERNNAAHLRLLNRINQPLSRFYTELLNLTNRLVIGQRSMLCDRAR